MASELEHVYCYRLGCGNCFKVGRTKNDPEERKRGLATGSPVKLNFYRDIETKYSSKLERYVHQLLDEKRAENGEYFNVTAQELDEAVDRAVSFVEESEPLLSEAKKLQHRHPNDTMVESSSEMLEIYRQLRALGREKYLIEQRIAFLESRIQVAIGDNCGMRGVASWKWRDHWTMDVSRFRKEQDALYEEYLRNQGCRKFCLEKIDLTRAD